MLEPISTEGLTEKDVDALMDKVRAKMLAEMEDMHRNPL